MCGVRMALVTHHISQQDKKSVLCGKHDSDDEQAADSLGMKETARSAQGFQLFVHTALVFDIGEA